MITLFYIETGNFNKINTSSEMLVDNQATSDSV